MQEAIRLEAIASRWDLPRHAPSSLCPLLLVAVLSWPFVLLLDPSSKTTLNAQPLAS